MWFYRFRCINYTNEYKILFIIDYKLIFIKADCVRIETHALTTDLAVPTEDAWLRSTETPNASVNRAIRAQLVK